MRVLLSYLWASGINLFSHQMKTTNQVFWFSSESLFVRTAQRKDQTGWIRTQCRTYHILVPTCGTTAACCSTAVQGGGVVISNTEYQPSGKKTGLEKSSLSTNKTNEKLKNEKCMRPRRSPSSFFFHPNYYLSPSVLSPS